MKLNLIALLWIAVVSFYSCAKNESTTVVSEHDEAAEWANMDSFHTIMSEAFHPYKDSANLEPLKRLAEEMAQEASAMALASLPQKVNNDAMKTQLNQLEANTRDLADMIKGAASDEEVGTSLEALHDSFHVIMKAWNDERQEQNHQH